ncbi:MAG: hypothetical protein JWM51_7 [Microbacteriaceae bacterium]|jgi:hypothetical protein|nr:hypothetical protein [Microbacteriaceae bacterium]
MVHLASQPFTLGPDAIRWVGDTIASMTLEE